MTNAIPFMQRALGDDWQNLPPALQAHHRSDCMDSGSMTIEYPRLMQPYLMLMRCFGALIDRPGADVATVVTKRVAGERHHWRRTLTWADNTRILFNSFWVHAGGNQLIEYVNPALGLQMAVHVDAGRLHYEGVRFVVKLGRWLLPIPEWLVLGHTTIVEEAIGENRFAMDFRLTHPLFGQVFRYAGQFVTREDAAQT